MSPYEDHERLSDENEHLRKLVRELQDENALLQAVVEEAFWEGVGWFQNEESEYISDSAVKEAWKQSDAKRRLDEEVGCE